MNKLINLLTAGLLSIAFLVSSVGVSAQMKSTSNIGSSNALAQPFLVADTITSAIYDEDGESTGMVFTIRVFPNPSVVESSPSTFALLSPWNLRDFSLKKGEEVIFDGRSSGLQAHQYFVSDDVDLEYDVFCTSYDSNGPGCHVGLYGNDPNNYVELTYSINAVSEDEFYKFVREYELTYIEYPNGRNATVKTLRTGNDWNSRYQQLFASEFPLNPVAVDDSYNVSTSNPAFLPVTLNDNSAGFPSTSLRVWGTESPKYGTIQPDYRNGVGGFTYTPNVAGDRSVREDSFSYIVRVPGGRLSLLPGRVNLTLSSASNGVVRGDSTTSREAVLEMLRKLLSNRAQ